MKYVNCTFTLPAGPGNVTQEEWEIAMGKRCPICLELMPNHGGGCEPDLRPESIRKLDEAGFEKVKEPTPLEIFDAAVNCPHCKRASDLTPSEGGCICLLNDEIPLEEFPNDR